MKRQIVFILLLICTIKIFSQNPPSHVVWVGEYGAGDSFNFTNTQNTEAFTNAYGGTAIDVWYKLEVLCSMELNASTCGTSFKSFAIYLLNEKMELIVSNDGFDDRGGCSGPHTYIEWVVEPGIYYIVSEGYGNDYMYNPITTNIQGSASPPASSLKEVGTFNRAFQYSNDQDTRLTSNEYSRGSGAEVNDMTYKFTIEHALEITISHCGSVLSPTFISLLDENNIELYRSDRHGQSCSCYLGNHACLQIPSLPAGTYKVVCEGLNADGVIVTNIQGELALTGNTRNTPIDIDERTADFSYSHTCDTQGYTDDYRGLPANDVFYKFVLSVPMDIILSHCGSALPDTYIYLLDSSGRCIGSNNDYSGEGACANTKHAYLKKVNLQEGIYYVVSEGNGSNGEIVTTIRGVVSDLKFDSFDGNYIQTRTYTNAEGTEFLDKIDYFDGFGRLEQSVQKQQTPSRADLITLQEYDFCNRESAGWLPAVFPDNAGQYISSADVKRTAIDQYNDARPYSIPVYEVSPLNRILEQYGPGENWQQHNRGSKSAYLTNVSGVDTLNCIYFTVTNVSDTILRVNRVRNYDTGQLYVTRMEDEDGNASFEFKDKLGQLVLTRRIQRSAMTKELYDTYYIYDDFGNRVTVLPPEASDAFNRSSNTSWTSHTDIILRQYAFLYRFDNRCRQIAKKLPGCDWSLYIHDKNDGLIFTQDGNQRQRGEWAFSIPDVFGRECFSGICKNSITSFPTALNSVVVSASWRSGTSSTTGTGPYKGYYLSGISLVSPTVLGVNYYDDYSFTGKNSIPDSTNINVKYEEEAGLEGFGKSYAGSAKTLLTGRMTAQLDHSGIPAYLYSVMYYDMRGRLVQTKSNNHLPGGVEKEYTAYNFTGQPVQRKRIHSATGKETQTELYSYSYDHAGRPLTTKHRLNNGTEITLVDNEYDELGRLRTNKRNGLSNLQTDYTYTIRSLIKTITGPLFNQTLYYNDQRAAGTNSPRYNGNISGVDWTVSTASDSKQRGYDFAYDNLSRLTKADYLESDVRNSKFNTSYTYDKHGNILSLIRHGNTGTTTYGTIDNLTLSYRGNQLIKVEDIATNPSLSMSMDFKDGAHQNIEYFYDANGNQVKDLNKSISNIDYNLLNLPKSIRFSGANNPVNEYVYSADGVKLAAIHTASTTKWTDYAGNMIYENGGLKMILVDGGYYEPTTDKYYFYLTDHLGSNRVVADQSGNVIQTNHYYPYGLLFAESAYPDKQSRKFIGKEMDTEQGLNWYDLGARPYDGIRMPTPDPMMEKYYSWSPYAYCMGNPVILFDPTGMWPDNPLIPRSGRSEYGSNAFLNAGRFIHNSATAIVNTPIDVINTLAAETKYIYDNGAGAYLAAGVKSVGDAIGSVVNTPISQQASDTWQAMKEPQNWENATAAAAFMLTPMKAAGTGAKAGSTASDASVVVEATKTQTLKPLGLGSTGRTAAVNLTEQLAMKEAMSNPAAGQIIQKLKPLTDSRWLGWRKMQYEHIGLDGNKTIIHFNGNWINGFLKDIDDFKFK